MDAATALAEQGALEGAVVRATFQTAGRGRSGRSWGGEAGSSLMLSVVLRPRALPSGLGALSLLAGLAVARTTEAVTSRRTTVKWPNDVLLRGRKVSGVLLQSRTTERPDTRFLIVGIGINVRSTPELCEAHAICLNEAADATVDMDDVFDRLLLDLDDVYRAFRAGDITKEVDDLNDRLAYLDQDVTIEDGDRPIRGTVVGIGERGELCLRLPDGNIRPVISGELTRGPKPVHR